MDNGKCFRHHNAECDICPYYEYTLQWEHGTQTGRFWSGQTVTLEWGPMGLSDSITLTPKQYQVLNKAL